MIGQRRVVVTGLGVLAANGVGTTAFWESLLAGRSGIGPISLFDAKDFKCTIAGEVKDFVPDNFIDPKFKARRMSRNVQFAGAAANMAVADARLTLDHLLRIAPILIQTGVSLGGFDHVEAQVRRVAAHGPNRLMPSAVEACIHLAAASTIAAILNVPARLQTLSNSCVGGLDAIATAAAAIARGHVDLAIAGGTDASISPSALAGFCAAGMVTTENRDPSRASRPYDHKRSGGVLAEGSGIVVLETIDHALARGVEPYVEIESFSSFNDQSNEPSGTGLRRTMQEVLESAGCLPEDIDYICAHGPSDASLDRVETEAIKAVMGPHAFRIPVSSIKGVTGNALAASGAHQVVTCALVARHGVIPPTANYEDPDPFCDLDYVGEGARSAMVNRIMINAHGSGRTNSSMIVKRFIRP